MCCIGQHDGGAAIVQVRTDSIQNRNQKGVSSSLHSGRRLGGHKKHHSSCLKRENHRRQRSSDLIEARLKGVRSAVQVILLFCSAAAQVSAGQCCMKEMQHIPQGKDRRHKEKANRHDLEEAALWAG